MEREQELVNIVIRCRGGERDAFEELYGIYQPRLKYYVRRLNGGGSGCDDMLQEIWLTVLKKIIKLKNARAFGVWIYRIARNNVYSGFRRKERFVRLPEESEIPVSGGDEPVFSAEDAEDVHRALEELQPYHREVLVLSFVERMTYKAIAEVVGCSVGTVRSRIFYAKQSLRKEMERRNGRE